MTGSGFKAAIGAVLIVLLWSTGSVQADQPRVIAAEASPNGDGSYTVSATIRHGDTGWDHYADNFEVLGPDGALLERRVLYHPHVDEQPFTRSVGGVKVPPGLKQVIVRAHDKVHGYGKATVTVTLPDR
ncbi:MAG: hypothetical protein CMM61_04605 [Rhodospirillaceae bacterium]|nr:hypothetical protein [Rhodospirillaceae bacterium]